ncbi:MAG: UbiA family prenyltransferase, partial [Acidobacteria bacterium]|nr:UbiA family prenyltransferase [Acidobacteriota bacterium]
ITIGLTLGPLPSLASYNAVQQDLAASAWPVFIGIGALITGRTLWWAIPDQSSDRATGMKTPPVQYGAFRTILIACMATIIGLGLLGWSLWSRYGPLPALLATTTGATFILSKFALLRRLSNQMVPNCTYMRRRSLSSVTVADVLFVLIPLIAAAS